MPLPLPVTETSALMKAFQRLHKPCPKTWQEPVAEAEGKSLRENVMWWLSHGEQGLSSKTMLKYLYDITMAVRESHPCDPNDFRRCHLLLEAVPQLRLRLGEMVHVSPVWATLVDNWDELTRLLIEQRKTHQDNGMYKLMKQMGC